MRRVRAECQRDTALRAWEFDIWIEEDGRLLAKQMLISDRAMSDALKATGKSVVVHDLEVLTGPDGATAYKRERRL